MPPFLNQIKYIGLVKNCLTKVDSSIIQKELSVFISVVGIKHNGIVCQSCKEIPILGMCWKCLDCMANCSLCTSCYMVDEHSKQHAFLRVDFPKEVG